MTEARYDDLMARRELIFTAWMKLVDEARREANGGPPPFYGTGVVLGKDGTLRIGAFNRTTGKGLFDLRIAPFSTEVEVNTG